MGSLVYKKIGSAQPVVDYVTNTIGSKLSAGQRVLWLVPGGSGMKVAAAVAQKLPEAQLANLIVTLTDERYAPVGHADSNWQQLAEAGFKLDDANLQPVIEGQDAATTAEKYAARLNQDLQDVTYSLALTGIGTDGHTFGIKPGSPAAETDREVVAYDWEDFSRITPTINLLKKLDEVVVYATGVAKWPQLDDLDQNLNPNRQPAQLLKQLNKVTIFNDYKGEEAK